MTKNLLFAGGLITSLFCAAALAQTKSGPPVPYIDKGACPFECCTYRQWSVEKPTAIRSAMKDSAPVSFRLKAGEKVQGMTGVVITTQPGIARALKNAKLGEMRIKKGEQFYVLTNLGEGFTKVWFKGRIFQGEPYDDSNFKFIREPKSIWWVKIKNRKGQIGWSREPEHFGNVDQCG
ncbi:MAG TPA: hypothetical protein VMZ26_10515 [Pyrinomonadaceae bacterium]|nr:hypothetical protein [Pyrinomonadaceae bacterium]